MSFKLDNGTDIRAVIPGVDRLAYFQTSGLGLKLQPALDAAWHWMRFQAAGAAHPDVSARLKAEFEGARRTVAGALGAIADEIVLGENATIGINIVANGIAWRPGDQVLLSDEEHPGNLIPWYNMASRHGVRLRFLPLAGNDDARLLQLFGDMLGQNTRVVSISHVSRRSGRRLPVRRLVDMAHARGVPVLLDGAQAFGAVPVNVRELDCDFYVFSGHKYIMAPQGTGGFYVRRDRVEWLRPSWVGSHSQSTMDGQGRLVLHDNARRFEFGTRNLSDSIAFGTALEFWERQGWRRVFAAIAAYTDELKAGLKRVPGLRLLTPSEYGESSGIVVFEIPGLEAALIQSLDEAGTSGTYIGALALSAIGSTGALPRLIDALTDPNRRGHGRRLAKTLARFGDKLLPPLSRALKASPEEYSLLAALEALEQTRPGTIDEFAADRSQNLRTAARLVRERAG